MFPKVYPRPATIMEAILPMMMAKRSIDMVREASAARTVHLWGLASTDAKPATGVAYTVVNLDSGPLGSPIIDAAEGLLIRLGGRQVWGFGLACWMVGELFTGDDAVPNGGVPDEVLRAMAGGPLKDRPTAEQLCAAMGFDARGRAYHSIRSLHMPELGETSWQENTLENDASTDAWIGRYYAGAPSAHAWAAAITRDAARNRSVLQRLRGPKAV
jgi:hypothetical protein